MAGVSGNYTIEQIVKDTESNETKSKRKTGGELGKDDFLNLLVTQLRYQDPLKPVDDKEFIAQMAQFSSLEQMQNMNGTMSQSQAFGMIGKWAVANIIDPNTLEKKVIEGEVSSVKKVNGKTICVIDGKDVESDKVVSVSDSIYNKNNNLAAYTNLIGYYVKGAVYDTKTGDVVYLSGDVTEIQKGLHEDYAVMDNVKVNIAEIITEKPSADPNFMEKYLKDNVGKEIKVVITDRQTGKKVPVTAKLESYEIKDGKTTAVVDGLYVPVESVANIKRP